MTVERHTGSFTAIDGGGNRHTLHKFTTFMVAEDLDGRHEEHPVAVAVRADGGLHVIRHGKGRYEVADTGLRLSSDHPDAP